MSFDPCLSRCLRRAAHHSAAPAAALSLLVLACGARTTMLDGEAAAGGATSSSSTTNSSVSVTTAETTATSTATTGAGGAPPLTCSSNLDCLEGSYCDYPGDDCGLSGVTGTCRTRDVSCTDDCPGVCGCDGAFYCNACEAGASGVDVDAEGLCHTSNVTYSARLWLGGLDHLLIFKADWERDTCLEAHLAWPGGRNPGFSVEAPEGWALQGAMMTHHASDCASDFIEGDLFGATEGKGKVDWEVPQGLIYPCEVSVDLTLGYAAPEPWILPVETMSATAIPVEEGCF